MDIYTHIDKARIDKESHNICFRPNKSLGQNFLHNTHIAQSIVDLLPYEEDTYTLEIGAGKGALTSLLQEKQHKLYIIERDPYWATIHSYAIPTICADALEIEYTRLHSSSGRKWQCISNLPYNIASPLIWNIISQAQCYCVFMVQREVGERLIAKEHSKEYGMLSAWVQSFCVPRKEFIVPPSAFFPAPKVYSMVLSFTPYNHDVIAALPQPQHFAEFLHLAFRHRRKQLLPVLKKQFAHALDIFDALHLPYTIRAEELSPLCLQQMTHLLYNSTT